ncbi:MAG TPA: 50S ribosomal protein L29 [Candidatus Paceibacterota bacterium]|nr:50S ribosomal protein L29 [Candidatus Paceibacterota bacterium]
MKKKDIQDLKNRSAADLTNLERESKEKLRVLRFDLAAGKVKNVAELRELKKKIARVKTFLKAKA